MKINDLKSLYIAHRGIQSNDSIENTTQAFNLAIKKKVPIELDIHILRDKNLVVFHDDNLKRLFDIDKKIEDYNYDELSKLTFNDNSKIPLFNDVLKLVSGQVLLVVEMKKSNIVRYSEYCMVVKKALEEYNYDIVIKSFDIRIVYWFLHNTEYLTGLLIANRNRSIYDYLMKNKLVLMCLKPDFISVDYHLLNDLTIRAYRKHNPVLTWTIRDSDTLNLVRESADSYLIDKFYF